MSGVLPWIVAYLAILLVWALIILRRPGPTLWKGQSLAVLNLTVVLASTIVGHLQTSEPETGFLVFNLVLITIAALVRAKWVLIGIDHAQACGVLERCFAQTRASSERLDDGYVVRCGQSEMKVKVRPNVFGSLSVQFAGEGQSKKAGLLRDLFGKQFHNSLPTLRFRA